LQVWLRTSTLARSGCLKRTRIGRARSVPECSAEHGAPAAGHVLRALSVGARDH
jgi:hypothetical protein